MAPHVARILTLLRMATVINTLTVAMPTRGVITSIGLHRWLYTWTEIIQHFGGTLAAAQAHRNGDVITYTSPLARSGDPFMFVLHNDPASVVEMQTSDVPADVVAPRVSVHSGRELLNFATMMQILDGNHVAFDSGIESGDIRVTEVPHYVSTRISNNGHEMYYFDNNEFLPMFLITSQEAASAEETQVEDIDQLDWPSWTSSPRNSSMSNCSRSADAPSRSRSPRMRSATRD